jgi:hypothetical protein
MGIEATSALPPVDAVDLTVDLGTGEVTAGHPSPRKVMRGGKEVSPLFWLKYGDSRLLHVRFTKGGVVWDGELSTFKSSLKNIEDESLLVTASSFARGDRGINTFYRMAVIVTGSALKGEVSGVDDDGTGIAAICELEWTWANSLLPLVGPVMLRTTSQTFLVGVAPELTANPS